MKYNPSELSGTPCLEQQNADGTWTPLSSTVNGDGTVSAILSHDGTFAVGSAVPEPGTIVLLGIAALAAVAFLRRKA